MDGSWDFSAPFERWEGKASSFLSCSFMHVQEFTCLSHVGCEFAHCSEPFAMFNASYPVWLRIFPHETNTQLWQFDKTFTLCFYIYIYIYVQQKKLWAPNITDNGSTFTSSLNWRETPCLMISPRYILTSRFPASQSLGIIVLETHLVTQSIYNWAKMIYLNSSLVSRL